MRDGIAHHKRQKQAVRLRAVEHIGTQIIEQLTLAVDKSLVKKDTRQHERFGLGLVNPRPKVLMPLLFGLAPLVGHGHHFAGAIDIATGV